MPEEEPKHEDRAAETTESSMFLTRTEAEASPPRIVGLRGKPPFTTTTTTSNFTTNKDKSWGKQSSRKHLGGRKGGREVATAMGVGRVDAARRTAEAAHRPRRDQPAAAAPPCHAQPARAPPRHRCAQPRRPPPPATLHTGAPLSSTTGSSWWKARSGDGRGGSAVA